MTELAIHAADRDIANELCEQVRSAYHDRTPLRIVAGNTRAFYGRPVEGTELNVAAHSGIVSYDPIELVVTVRAGTRLSALNAALAEKHQMLPFSDMTLPSGLMWDWLGDVPLAELGPGPSLG